MLKGIISIPTDLHQHCKQESSANSNHSSQGQTCNSYTSQTPGSKTQVFPTIKQKKKQITKDYQQQVYPIKRFCT